MVVGPDNHDSFFIEGQSKSGPNDDNFAEDDDFNGPPQEGYYCGLRRPPGMSESSVPLKQLYSGGSLMGHWGPSPFGMQCGPPHSGYGGPRPSGPHRGQRYQGPPRGMGVPRAGDCCGLKPGLCNGPRMDSMDGPQRGGLDMQGPPNQQNEGQDYIGGGQLHQGPNYGRMTPHQGYNNGPNHNNYGPGGGGMQSGSGLFHSRKQQPPSSGQSKAQDMDTSTSSNEDIWAETKSADEKSYYYHAKSRETAWTKPEGPNVKVLSQQQVEAMALQQTAANIADEGSQQNSNNYNNPPQQQPYYPQPGWNVPQAAPVASAPVLGPGPMPYPVLTGSDPGTDSVILAQAMPMEWCQYRSPEGKPYFFNVKTSTNSVWEKPQILKDYEVVRLAAAARFHAGCNIPTVQIIPEHPSKESITKPEVKVPIKDKRRHISSTFVAGTLWFVVWTGDGRVYNPSTRSSVWEKPEDIQHRPDVDKLLANTPDRIISENKNDVKEDTKKKRSNSFVEEPPVKKVKTVEEDSNDVKPKEPAAKDSAIEAELKAAQQRGSLLAEKEVPAFSTREIELDKIVFDSRHLLLTSNLEYGK